MSDAGQRVDASVDLAVVVFSGTPHGSGTHQHVFAAHFGRKGDFSLDIIDGGLSLNVTVRGQIVINDCRCLLSNTMLSGSLVNYLIEKESLIAIPRIVSFAGIPEQEAKQAFRFTFAGIFSIYSSYDWSKHTIKDFPKELIRKCCATTIKSTLQSESTVSDRLQRGLSND